MRPAISRVMVPVLLSIICTILLSTPSPAQPAMEDRSHWGIARVQGMMTLPVGNDHAEIYNDCGDSWFDFLNFGASINVNTSGGVLGSFEYVLARRFGIELGLYYWRQIVDIKFEAEGITIEGAPNFIMPTLGFNYHFMTDSKADLYLGAFATLGVMATAPISR